MNCITEGTTNGSTDCIKLLVLGVRKVRVELSRNGETETQAGVMNILDLIEVNHPDLGATWYNLIGPAASSKTKALGIPARYGIEEYNPANLHANNISVPWAEVIRFARKDGKWEMAE